MKQPIVKSVLSILVLLAAAGCGPGDPPEGFGEEEHHDIEIGSSEDGGGALVLHYESEHPVEVAFSECLGGTGEVCDGGVALYASEDPGFAALEEAEPDVPLFPLLDGERTRLVLVAADPGVSLFMLGTLLDEPGESVTLPVAPEIHVHGGWQLALAGGTAPEDSYSLELRLESIDGGYGASEVLLVEIEVHDEADPDHDHEE